jgi:3-oxoacyl-[acyl-carrier-protein] synthase-1
VEIPESSGITPPMSRPPAEHTKPVRPYPITAYGVVSGLGRSTDEVWASLRAGSRGLSPCPLAVPFQTLSGAVLGDLPAMPPGREDYESRVVRLTLLAYQQIEAATQRAIQRWGAGRVALLLSTSTGGIGETESAYEHFLAHGSPPGNYDFARQHSFAAFADVLREVSGIEGPRFVISTACSSSAKVFGTAQRLLDADVVDAAIVGGVDALCLTTVRGFHSLGVMATGESRPFGAERPGMNVGEGAALLLIERDGEGDAWVLGVGETSDAFHMSAPDPEGRGAQLAMEGALAQAGLAPTDIHHINAHGTGTARNDVVEAIAIERVFGTAVPTVSTKGYTGHTLAASGATEAIFAILTMKHGYIPGSAGAHPLDPEVRIDVVDQGREAKVDRVLSNAFAFGGNNVSVILGRTP